MPTSAGELACGQRPFLHDREQALHLLRILGQEAIGLLQANVIHDERQQRRGRQSYHDDTVGPDSVELALGQFIGRMWRRALHQVGIGFQIGRRLDQPFGDVPGIAGLILLHHTLGKHAKRCVILQDDATVFEEAPYRQIRRC